MYEYKPSRCSGVLRWCCHWSVRAGGPLTGLQRQLSHAPQALRRHRCLLPRRGAAHRNPRPLPRPAAHWAGGLPSPPGRGRPRLLLPPHCRQVTGPAWAVCWARCGGTLEWDGVRKGGLCASLLPLHKALSCTGHYNTCSSARLGAAGALHHTHLQSMRTVQEAHLGCARRAAADTGRASCARPRTCRAPRRQTQSTTAGPLAVRRAGGVRRRRWRHRR